MKVPQHLELQDVVAWGLGAVDLLCVIGALTVSWWLYLTLSADPALRLALVLPIAAAGLACGFVRVGDVALREWASLALAYLLRPRVLVAD